MMTPDPFVSHRNLLFTVAYEMLGSAADAEDVLQEAWLRWSKVDHSRVREPRAYLIRIVSRQALNRIRTLSRRREEYVGEWLPEPVLTNPDIAGDLELAENVSFAMLIVLETLGPMERAVFVLHEVFGMPYNDISNIIRKPAAAVRQLLVRPNRVMNVSTVWLNGEPGARIDSDGATAFASFEVENGRIVRIYAIANPQKLTRLDKPVQLAR